MRERGTLLHCDEAMRIIEQVEDPITRNLLNMGFVHLVKKSHLEQQQSPCCDFDMLYFVNALKDFFAEHDVLAQTLAGETVGAWFNDEE